MHDNPPPDTNADSDDGYEWPRCVACDRDLWQTELQRWACRPCELKTAERLRELPALFARLNTTTALVRSHGHTSSPTTGSRVPPIPANPHVLSLAAVGGVATRLRDIEDSWRRALGWTVAPWRGNPGEAVPKHIEFLANNLPWAVENYEPIGQDAEEIRRLHAECGIALDPSKRGSRVRIGACPVTLDNGPCGQPLTASTASARIRCNTCGAEWPDMAAWRDLRHAQEAAAETAQTAA